MVLILVSRSRLSYYSWLESFFHLQKWTHFSRAFRVVKIDFYNIFAFDQPKHHKQTLFSSQSTFISLGLSFNHINRFKRQDFSQVLELVRLTRFKESWFAYSDIRWTTFIYIPSHVSPFKPLISFWDLICQILTNLIRHYLLVNVHSDGRYNRFCPDSVDTPEFVYFFHEVLIFWIWSKKKFRSFLTIYF